jgi:arylsulfatase A-like enzyme
MKAGYQRIVVLTIDRLGISCLGPYGATWNDTPEWNAWAAKSLVGERMIADSIDLARIMRSYWTGHHAARETLDLSASLPRQLASAQWESRLFTDDKIVAELGESSGFADVALFHDEETQTAIDAPHDVDLDRLITSTAMGRAFAAAWEELVSQPERSLFWMHLRGLASAWDAPYAWRAAFCDDEDPPPPREVVPPSKQCDNKDDPDERWGYLRCYAAQVRLLDRLLARTREILEEQFAPGSTLVVLTSPRGFALADHGVVGETGDNLSSPLLRVPLFLTDLTPDTMLARSQAIMQPADVMATLLDAIGDNVPAYGDGHSWLRLAGDQASSWPRDRAFSISPTEQAILTPAWFFRRIRGGTADQGELFVQPDDACDANAIGSRRPEIVELFNQQWDALESILRESRHLADLPPLSPEATAVWR